MSSFLPRCGKLKFPKCEDLASIPIYLIYITKIPKWAIKATNSQMAIFSRMTKKTVINTTWLILST
jgi:hypothetical protein